MARTPSVLLLDDGELDDIQEILDEIGEGYARVRGGAIPPRTPAPSRLLISTPRRVEAVQLGEQEGAGDGELIRIVVVEVDSPTLRARLREVGFDYLVRRPVHPEALRLLLLHCLYSGEERRGEPRTPMGLDVSFRSGLRARSANLADLSTRGCRLLSRWPLEPGKRVRLSVPRSGDPEDALTLRGEVVRVGIDEHLGPEGPYSAGVAFSELDAETRQELEWLLEERARGPASLGEVPAPRDDGPLDLPETRGEDLAHGVSMDVVVRLDMSTVERRDGSRASYDRKIPAFDERALRVMVARDLSRGGMRVERESGLQVGDRLHLAIYGEADAEPVLVWATVDRDDGKRGMALVFDTLEPDVGATLEALVANLPSVEALGDDEARAMGTVVSEILDR